MNTQNEKMEEVKELKMRNGLVRLVKSLSQGCIKSVSGLSQGCVKSVSGLCQVCVKSVFGRNQGRTNSLPTPYQLPTKALSMPYKGRINALLSYNFFRRLAAAFALVVLCSANTFGQINMQNGSRTLTCGEQINFYDDGGSGSNYTTSKNYTYTFSSSTGPITIKFSQFVTESTTSNNWDNIKIYDGTAADGIPLVFGCTGWTNGFNGAATGFQNLLAIGTTYICHSGTMTVVWKSDGSTTEAGWQAVVECGYRMSNGLNANMTCGNTYCFFDDGGVSGNYATSQNQTAIFRTNGNIVINFSQFVTESTGASDWDNIKIYDGDVTSGRKLVFGCTGWSSGFTGAAAGFENILSTGTNYTCTSGIMTVVWKSDGSTTAAGWQATITTNNCCTRRTGTFAFAEENASVSAGQVFTQTVTNTTGADGVSYSMAPAGIANINTTTGAVTTTAGRYGTVTITATIPAGGGYCKTTASYNLDITNCENSIVLNRNLSKNIECGTEYCFYDSGIDGVYQNNEGYTATFTSSGVIHIRFETALQGESGYDYMSIDGITTTVSNASSIAAGTEYVSSSTGGSVTIRWRSDGSGQYNGWKAIITATGCGPSTTYTCDSPNTEITLGDGGSSNYTDAPIGVFWNYSYHQILYTAEDLGGSSGTIYAIGFQYASTTAMSVKNDVTIYLANTDANLTQFAGATWQTPTFTQVYTGRFNFTQQGWGWIVLDSPFDYEGGSLIMALDDNSGAYQSLNFYYHSKTNSHLRYNNDSNNPDHPNPSQTATLSSNRPNTKFCIEQNCTNRDGHVRITSGCVTTLASGQTTTLVGSVDAGYGGGTAHWSSSDDNIATVNNSGVVTGKTPGTVTITYTRDNDDTYCTASATCEITVECATNTQTFAFSPTVGSVAEEGTLPISGYLTAPAGAMVTYASDNTGVATVTNAGVVTGVSAGTAHITATVAQWTASNGVTYCGRTATNSFTVTVSGVTCENTSYTIGNEEGTGCTYAPINNYWHYSIRQIIYDSDEICAGEINGIAFDYAYTSPTTTRNNVKIYLGKRSGNIFSSPSDWTSVDEMTEVYSGPLNFSRRGWKWFEFHTPFVYDGENSLVMMIVDNSNGTDNSSFTFYQTSCSGNKMLYAQNDGSTDYDVNNLSAVSSWAVGSYRPDTRFCIDCCTERDDAIHITNSCPIDVPYGSTVQLNGRVDVGAGDVIWSSNKTGVAGVSGSGLVTPSGIGTATITYARAYDGTYCATNTSCVVNVVVPTPSVNQTDSPLPECGDGNVHFTASVPSVPAGYVYHWYSNSSCTSEITTGVSGPNNNTLVLSTPAASGGNVWCRLEKPASTVPQTFIYNGTTSGTTAGTDGSIQTYIIPEGTASLTLEVWGAQGGSYSSTYYGGKGGYSKGTLTSPVGGSTLYIVVGGQPAAYTTTPSTGGYLIAGGYNGGGSTVVHFWNSNWTLPQGGGGATHIATATGLLSDLSEQQDNVLIVAGGGSGGGCYNNGSTSGYVGYAGGGTTSNGYTGGTYTYTANQTTAGNGGSFGRGASYTSESNWKYGPSGGGGGWYGGGNRQDADDTYSAELVLGHGGGSGYIKSTLTATAESNGSREGNGQAKITASIPTITGPVGIGTIKCCGIEGKITITAP